MRKLITFVLLLFAASPLLCQTIRPCDGTETDCQNKVNAAVDGDTVQVPAGTFNWPNNGGRAIGWANKNINVLGASSPAFSPPGTGQTIIIGVAGSKIFYNQITNATKGQSRISGFTFQVASGSLNTCVHVDASGLSTSAYGFRIDHNDFKNCATTADVSVFGLAWGVVDHNTFEGDSDMVLVYSNTGTDFTAPGTKPGNGQVSWNLPTQLGSLNAVYAEDNVITETTGALAVNDMEYGARIVFRHNTVTNAYFQSHSPRSSNRGGALSWEVYNNTWNGNGAGGPALRPFLILGGTGVIFNNTITGYSGGSNITFGDQRSSQQVVSAEYWECAGTADAHGPPTPYTWDGNIETSGWPCMDQIGRGAGTQGSEPSLPALLWNNGTTATCATGGACDNVSGVILNGVPAGYIQTTAHSNGDKDYCIGTTMPTVCGNVTTTYTPAVYPHPLVGAAAPTASFTPSPVNVGLVPLGLTSNPVSVTLKNTGSATLTNTSITLSNALFSIVSNTCGSPATITNLIPGTGFTLAVNATCTFSVIASPTSIGVTTTNAVFTENTSGGSDTLVLNATGTGNPALNPVIFAGKAATSSLCKVVPAMTQLCFATDCNCWWASVTGGPYAPLGVSSINSKTGAVVLAIQ